MARIDAAITIVHRVSSRLPNEQEIVNGLNLLKSEVLDTVSIDRGGYVPRRVYSGMSFSCLAT